MTWQEAQRLIGVLCIFREFWPLASAPLNLPSACSHLQINLNILIFPPYILSSSWTHKDSVIHLVNPLFLFLPTPLLCAWSVSLSVVGPDYHFE